MPAQQEFKTDRTGVYYIMAKAPGGGEERIYYIRFKISGRLIVEKAGRAGQGMTPAKAARLRAAKIEGKTPTNKQVRTATQARKSEIENRPTLSRLWAEYQAQNSIKGIVTDQNRFDLHIKPTFGDRTPAEIVPLDLDRLRVRLLKKKSPATVRNVLELFRRIVNFGVKKQLCEPLGFTVTMPKVNNTTTEDLTTEQLKGLLEAINEDSHQAAGAMMKLALFSGLRRGEMFRLKWEHIDFSKMFIRLVDPKGGADQIIPLNESARTILESLPRGSDFVFPGRGGGQRVEIGKALRRIKTAAGLPADFRPLHGLRHAYASMLASSGRVDMYVLQRLLTHKSPQMTQRYAHLRDETLRNASNLAGEIIGSALNLTESDENHEVANEQNSH